MTPVKAWIQNVSKTQPLLPGVVATILSLGMWHLGFWQPLEQLGYNVLFQIRAKSFLPHSSWDRRVALIAIDEASLREYGRFPWPRDRYTQLLQALAKSPPAAIGFDILFVESSPDDRQLATAIANNGRVVLAQAWDERGNPLNPVATLDAAAADRGHILHKPDADGTSRQAIIHANGQASLAMVMLNAYNTDRPNHPVTLPQPVSGQEWQRVWINWPGTAQALSTYSFADVVKGRIPASALANKLVLVGVTATGLDPLVSPLNQNPPLSGVYLHAALIDNLLNQRLLKPFPDSGVILLLLLIGLPTSWLFSNRRLLGWLVIALLLPSAWMGIALAAFTQGWWLPIAAPIGTILFAGVGVQLRAQFERQQLMSLFAKHVAPEMADLIWRNKSEIFANGELQAQELTATVLFVDIRGFTTISTKLSPRELLSWLNHYLEAMTDCIMDRGGAIDKYIGDAIMAVFGVPFAHTDPEAIKQDAIQAIAASLAMYERLQRLNQHLLASAQPTIQLGIGIHTGLVVAGSVGGARRLNYSVLGDTVNIAARLEAMNKEVQFDTPYKILVTSDTYVFVKEWYVGEPVGVIQLQGREEKTAIYAILGER